MPFEHDIEINVKVKKGKPSVSIIGGPISHGELRVLIKLIEDEYVKYLREIRNERRSEQPKSK